MTTDREYPEIISGEQLAALKARAELVPELVEVLDAICMALMEEEYLDARLIAKNAGYDRLARAHAVLKDAE